MKTRYKVLKEFTRNVAGGIVHGDPEHPDENGRIVTIDADAAQSLVDEGFLKEYSLKDEARDELAAEQEAADGNVDGANVHNTGMPAQGRKSAQEVRDARTNTGTKGATATKRRPPAKGKPAAAGDAGGAPAGGRDTNASTNHPAAGVTGVGESVDIGTGGATADPEGGAAPDAAP